MSDIPFAIAAPLRPGEVVELRGRRIEVPLDLSGRALGHLDLRGTVFAAPLRLAGTVFEGLAWFQDCRFEAGIDASGARFDRCLLYTSPSPRD